MTVTTHASLTTSSSQTLLLHRHHSDYISHGNQGCSLRQLQAAW